MTHQTGSTQRASARGQPADARVPQTDQGSLEPPAPTRASSDLAFPGRRSFFTVLVGIGAASIGALLIAVPSGFAQAVS